MIYDIIIIWAWAAWLFTSINLPKKLNKLILEKNNKSWTKVLLSWWERANVSNINIDIEKDYFWQNKKSLISIFNKYNQWDLQSFFAENWINIVEEDRWRLILESWNSKELLKLLEKKSIENNTQITLNSEIIKIEKIWKKFKILDKNWEIYNSKNVIISTWWKSFFQTWTTWDWYNFANFFWINIISPYRSLCWLTTKKDFSSLSWNSLNLNIKLFDNNTLVWQKKEIYNEYWPLLFTHFWISWPIVFNTSTRLWEYLNSINIYSEQDKIKYILKNIIIQLDIKKENTTKKIYNFFKKELENWENIIFWLQDFRSWKEAKATWWWIDINELDKYMQSKKYKWLYFIWEIVDITWKTGWFNLQWAFSSAYIASQNFN